MSVRICVILLRATWLVTFIKLTCQIWSNTSSVTSNCVESDVSVKNSIKYVCTLTVGELNSVLYLSDKPTDSHLSICSVAKT